jgi:ABC-type transport system substrate-binding protein
MKRPFQFVGALLSVALLLGIVTGVKPAATQPAGTFVYVRSSDATFLDIGFSNTTEDVDVGANVLESLLRVDAAGHILPALATSWTQTKGQIWTFKLRPGVKFHDGTPVDADAVVFSVNRYRPDSPYYYKGRVSNIRRWLGDSLVQAEAVDAMTVRIILKDPYGFFPSMLAYWGIPVVSPTAVRKLGDNFARQPVGSGPFKFGEWVKDDHITLVANKDYWGGAPGLEQVVYKVVPDPSSRLLELKAGSGHFLKWIQPDQLKVIQGDTSLVLVQRPSSSIGYLAINNTKKPFDNILVRRAIAHAVDRESIVRDVLNGLGIVAVSVIPPWMTGFNPRVRRYPYDRARARELLKEAGFPSGFSTSLWTFNVERAYLPNVLRVAEKVRADLVAVGINARLQVNDAPVHFAKTDALEHELAMKGGYYPPLPDFLLRAQVLGPSSATGYPVTPRGQMLIQMAGKAAQTTDPDEQKRLYGEIQRIYMEDLPMVPLVHGADSWVYNANFTGVAIPPDGVTRFYGVKRK